MLLHSATGALSSQQCERQRERGRARVELRRRVAGGPGADDQTPQDCRGLSGDGRSEQWRRTRRCQAGLRTNDLTIYRPSSLTHLVLCRGVYSRHGLNSAGEEWSLCDARFLPVVGRVDPICALRLRCHCGVWLCRSSTRRCLGTRRSMAMQMKVLTVTGRPAMRASRRGFRLELAA
jgi:hypothetical protein